MAQLILTTPDDLRSIIREELGSINIERSPAQKDSELLKRVDVAEMFGITLTTVHSWMNSGLIPFHRISGRVFFKKSEVLQAMKQVKIRRKSAA
jgi:excisionase family DNA binding protein